MVITRAKARAINEVPEEQPLNFHLPERQPRQPRPQQNPQPIAHAFQFNALNVLHAHPVNIPQPQPVFQFNAVNEPHAEPVNIPQPQPRRGRPRVAREHEQEDVLFFADRPPVFDAHAPTRTPRRLVSEAMDWIKNARDYARDNETEIRNIENYKLNSPFTIFHEYVDNLNHLMNRMGSITTDADVIYAFASRNLRPYFRGIYNWNNRAVMLNNLHNYDMAILGTLTNYGVRRHDFNHYVAVMRWRDPQQNNRMSLLYYDPEHSVSDLHQFHHFDATLQEEGFTRVQIRGSYNKDDQANTEFNCGARCIAFLLTVIHHSDKTFEHIRVVPRI